MIYFILDLMKNNFGNYVVQKALKISTGAPKLKLIVSILKNIEKIGDKKLIIKWRNIVIGCLPKEIEMNNIDGDLIYKLLKSIPVDEISAVNKISNQIFINKGNNSHGKIFNIIFSIGNRRFNNLNNGNYSNN